MFGKTKRKLSDLPFCPGVSGKFTITSNSNQDKGSKFSSFPTLKTIHLHSTLEKRRNRRTGAPGTHCYSNNVCIADELSENEKKVITAEEQYRQHENCSKSHVKILTEDTTSLAQNSSKDDGQLERSTDNKTVVGTSESGLKPRLLTQVVGALAGSLIHFSLGTIFGLTGVILPSIMDTSSSLHLDEHQAALFSSLLNIGALVGSVASGPMMLGLGQRVTLLASLPFAAIGWMLLAFSQHVWLLLVARILLGIVVGTFGGPSANYVAEISHSTVRGRLAGLVDLFRQLGFLFVYVIGSTGINWRHTCMVCACTTIIPFLVLYFLPNSPRWLVTKSKFSEARKSLQFYRGKDYYIDGELKEINEQVQNAAKEGTGLLKQLRKVPSFSIIKRMSLLSFLFFAYQFSGNLSMILFSVTIFQSVESHISEYTSTIIVGGVRVSAVLSYILVADKLGRRPLLISSLLFSSMSIGLLGGYFYAKNLDFALASFSWIPLVTLAVFIYFTCIAEPVLMLLRGELLPTSFRPLGTSVIYVFFFGGSFLVSYLFPVMMNDTGAHGTFWTYAADSLVMAIVVVLFIPETQGQTLEDIERYYRKEEQRETEVQDSVKEKNTNGIA